MFRLFKAAKIAGIILTLFNFFLCLDLYVLPSLQYKEMVTHINPDAAFAHPNVYIETNTAREILLTRAPHKNDSLEILISPVFSVITQIRNLSTGIQMNKTIDGNILWHYFSPVFLLVGIAGFFID